MTDSVYVLGTLCAIVVVSEVLVRRTPLRHAGTALIVIIVTAIAANTGLLPAGSTQVRPVPVYDYIFATIAPLSIFWLILPVNLRDVLKAGRELIFLFLAGSLATAVGVFVAMWVLDGPSTFGPDFPVLGGMFVGTYSGGSVNFNTIALEYDMVRNGALYGGSIVVDNIMTTVWMVATLAVPRFLSGLWPGRHTGLESRVKSLSVGAPVLGIETDTESVHPLDLGMLLALGFGSIWLAGRIGSLMPAVPTTLILTVIALVLAQVPSIARLAGIRVLGMFAVYLFLAVVGAFCDVAALRDLGTLGPALMAFVAITVVVHGLLVYGLAFVTRMDVVLASVASQANVGGATSALALARSLGRKDLVLPAILVGTLGTAIGSFLGFWVAASWLPVLG